MATTLQDMIDEMRDHGFTDTATSRLIGFLNDSYYDICSREPWPFLETSATITTVAGTASVSLPADFRAALSLVSDTTSTNRILVPERLEMINKRFAGGLTTQGTPLYYYFVADTLSLYPVPDAVYSLKLQYLAIPTAMAASADVPLLPDRHRRAIVLGAMVSAYRMEDDAELAAVFEGQFEKRLQLMREDLWRKQFDRPDMIWDLYAYDDVWE